MQEEQRQHARKPKFLSARIDTGATSPRLRCDILDLSTGGAKIALQSASMLPEAFTLMLPDTTTFECRLVWQADNEAGVEFNIG